jgi:hypothetical protein
VVKYCDVRAISVKQDIWGRIFNYGAVDVSTAAQTENELIIEGVVDPWELAMLIDQIRSRSQRIQRGQQEPTEHPDHKQWARDPASPNPSAYASF